MGDMTGSSEILSQDRSQSACIFFVWDVYEAGFELKQNTTISGANGGDLVKF